MASVPLLSARGIAKSFGTNHLDIDSIEVLEDPLEHYDGTVVAVSHDRYLLDRIADRIVVVADGAAHAYEGGWSANLARV
jgi:ATP-binding cassette, subfamily F, member 3